MTAAGKTEKREPYIDCLRGTAIIFVVLGHLNPGMILETWIYSFHMFLFFFLSGYLFHPKKHFGQQAAAAAKSCLIPYFFWNLCAVLFSLAIGEYDCLTALCKLFYIGGSVSWNSPVWFLVVLFWLKLLGQAAAAHGTLQWALIPVGMALGYLNVLGNMPFGISILPTALVFFLMGMILRDSMERHPKRDSSVWLIVCMVCVLLGGSVLFGVENSRISVYGVYYGRYFLAIPAGISGVLGLWLIHKLAYTLGMHIRSLEYWGRYTLNVMCTHYFMLRGLSAWSVHYMNGYDLWHSEGFWKAVPCTAMVFVLEYLAIETLKRLNCSSTCIFIL